MALTFSSKALIQSVSCGAEQLTGYSPQDLIGRPITHVLADGSAFEVPQMLESAREWGMWEGDLDLLDRSGIRLRCQSTIACLHGRGDQQSGYLLSATPTRHIVLNSEERGVIQQVGGQLRMISHELNNPLAVIMGFSQLIMLSTQCTGKVRSDMEKITSEMQRVIQAVEKLHQYAVNLQEECPGSEEVVGSAAS